MYSILNLFLVASQICLFLLYSQAAEMAGGFTPDGIIKQVILAQNLVDMGTLADDRTKSIDDNIDSIIAIKFGKASVMTSVSRRMKLKPPSNRILKFPDFICAFAGNPTDCKVAARLVRDIDDAYFSEHSSPISAAILALRLADDAQERSLYTASQRPLAYNALILGRESRQPTTIPRAAESTETATATTSATSASSSSAATRYKFSSVGLFRTDTGGNFYRCQASCIGPLSERVDYWMETRGAYLAAEHMRQQHTSTTGSGPDSRASDVTVNGNGNGNTTATVIVSSGKAADGNGTLVNQQQLDPRPSDASQQPSSSSPVANFFGRLGLLSDSRSTATSSVSEVDPPAAVSSSSSTSGSNKDSAFSLSNISSAISCNDNNTPWSERANNTTSTNNDDQPEPEHADEYVCPYGDLEGVHSDMSGCLHLAWSCLKECIGLGTLENCTIEIAAMVDTDCDTFFEEDDHENDENDVASALSSASSASASASAAASVANHDDVNNHDDRRRGREQNNIRGIFVGPTILSLSKNAFAQLRTNSNHSSNTTASTAPSTAPSTAASSSSSTSDDEKSNYTREDQTSGGEEDSVRVSVRVRVNVGTMKSVTEEANNNVVSKDDERSRSSESASRSSSSSSSINRLHETTTTTQTQSHLQEEVDGNKKSNCNATYLNPLLSWWRIKTATTKAIDSSSSSSSNINSSQPLFKTGGRKATGSSGGNDDHAYSSSGNKVGGDGDDDASGYLDDHASSYNSLLDITSSKSDRQETKSVIGGSSEALGGDGSSKIIRDTDIAGDVLLSPPATTTTTAAASDSSGSNSNKAASSSSMNQNLGAPDKQTQRAAAVLKRKLNKRKRKDASWSPPWAGI